MIILPPNLAQKTLTYPSRNPDAELAELTDKWKRALAEAENARKRVDAARLDGRDHGVVLAVEALALVYDDICLAIEAARVSPEADNPLITAYVEGLKRPKSAFVPRLKALGVKEIAPEDTPFDPVLHEAMQMQETDKIKPGQVLVLHRAGFALGKRLIRPAHVTVSARPGKPKWVQGAGRLVRATGGPLATADPVSVTSSVSAGARAAVILLN